MPARSRRRFDDDDYTPPTTLDLDLDFGLDEPDEPMWSDYVDATHGPQPTPEWVITSPGAVDTDLGVMKTGKEADVSLRCREFEGRSALMAVKQYRDLKHRMFHRDAGYLEGRRVRRSREGRAMANRTQFGLELIAGQWASAEFAVLSRLWQAGAAVPYPVQLAGTELTMEFIGDRESEHHGIAAPRLAQLRPTSTEARSLYRQLRQVLLHLSETGYAHGDLSAYNILVHHGRLVLIDLPQAVDLVGNPQGFQFLRRDCVNICDWFLARGVPADPDELCAELLHTVPHV